MLPAQQAIISSKLYSKGQSLCKTVQNLLKKSIRSKLPGINLVPLLLTLKTFSKLIQVIANFEHVNTSWINT